MRIGVDLTTSMGIQGTEVFALNLIRNAAESSNAHEWVFFVTSEDLKNEIHTWGVPTGRVRVCVLSRGGGAAGRAWAQQYTLRKKLRLEKIEFLFSPSPFFCWFAPIPVAVTVHDCAYAQYPEFRNFVSRLYITTSLWLARRLRLRIYTVSEFSRSELVRVYGLPNSTIVMLSEGPPDLLTPVDMSDAGWRAQWNIRDHYFVYIGVNRPRKNLARLLRAFAQLQKLHPEVQLVLVGGIDNTFFNVGAAIHSLGLQGAVVQTGFVSQQTKAAILSQSTALVFPSLYEGFGLPILEAQQIGVPVVASATSSMPEVAGAGALYCDPLSVQGIAQAMEQMLDSGTRLRLIAAGTENVKRFSWRTTAQIFVSSLSKYADSTRK